MNKRFVWIPEDIKAMTPSLVSKVSKEDDERYKIQVLYPYAKTNKKGVVLAHKVLFEEEIKGDLDRAIERAAMRRKELSKEISVKYQKTLHISAPKQGKINLKK